MINAIWQRAGESAMKRRILDTADVPIPFKYVYEFW